MFTTAPRAILSVLASGHRPLICRALTLSTFVFGATLSALPAHSQEVKPALPTYGPALSCQNLTLFPLYPPADEAASKADFLTFEEAGLKKLVRVTELQGNTSDAQVSAVHITNNSDRPIFILAGEIILGGKQDRVINQNTVIPPKAQQLEVGVFCVEQGRWNGQAAFQASGQIGHTKLRSAAVFNKDQGTVWQEVADMNLKNEVAPSTGTYRATLADADQNKRVDACIAALLPPLEKDPKAAGLAVAIDGEMTAMDIFPNPKLFTKVRTKLVHAYVLEALASDQAKENRLATDKDAQEFLGKIGQAKPAAPAQKSGAADNTFFDEDDIEGAETSSDNTKVHKFYRKKAKFKTAPNDIQRRELNLDNNNEFNPQELPQQQAQPR